VGVVTGLGVYGSAAGDVDFGSSDSSSDDDDFGIAEQKQLFEAARRRLSNSLRGDDHAEQQQRAPVAAAGTAAAAQWVDDADDAVSDVEIPEDLSVPLEVGGGILHISVAWNVQQHSVSALVCR
jgi:hypothetical protein